MKYADIKLNDTANAPGKRHSELTQKFKVPLRKNLAENQTIFYNLYPQFVEKGDD
jgi:hypothetical protein